MMSSIEKNLPAIRELTVLDHVPMGMFVLKADYTVLFWNRCLEDWTGIKRSMIVEKDIGLYFPHLKEPVYSGRLKGIFKAGPPVIFSSLFHKHIIPTLLPDGQKRILQTTVTSFCLSEEHKYHALFAIQDVTDLADRVNDMRNMFVELEEVRNMEHKMAYYDNLTGLPNRQLFYDRLNQVMSFAERNKNRVALMFIDLDGFKAVNDTLGHDIGDLLLKAVAGRLSNCLRKSDTVARLGGDEFTVILPDIKRFQDAGIVAEKILDLLNKPFELEGHNISISGSIGISHYPEDALGQNALLKNADMAMYSAKENGKNNYCLYSDVICVTK